MTSYKSEHMIFLILIYFCLPILFIYKKKKNPLICQVDTIFFLKKYTTQLLCWEDKVIRNTDVLLNLSHIFLFIISSNLEDNFGGLI